MTGMTQPRQHHFTALCGSFCSSPLLSSEEMVFKVGWVSEFRAKHLMPDSISPSRNEAGDPQQPSFFLLLWLDLASAARTQSDCRSSCDGCCAANTYEDSSEPSDCVVWWNPFTYGKVKYWCTDCKYCADGQILFGCGSGSAGTCSNCQAGYVSAGGYTSSCSQCEKGKYAPQGSKTCTSCSAGSYAGKAASGSCTECPAGKVAAKSGLSTCSYCPAGTSSGKGASSCSDCAKGKYAAQQASSSCSDCAAGTYAAKSASSSCLACPAGQAAPSKGSVSCSTCLAGTYSLLGAASCVNCTPGRYGSSPGGSFCSTCPPGRASVTFAAANYSTCLVCDPGKFMPSESGVNCELCAAGTFAEDAGAKACEGCPAGYWSSEVGASSNDTCTSCSPGTWSQTVAADSETDCLDCSTGRWSSSSAVSECASCEPGRWSNSTGASTNETCIGCAAGRSSPWTSASAEIYCSTCLVSFFAASPGSSSCDACATGMMSVKGSAACFFCPAGTYAGLMACVTCPVLKYSTGSGVCMSCPAGRIFNASQIQCDPCPVGTWSDAFNSAVSPKCLLCIAGRFGVAQNASSDSTDSSSCAACATGMMSLKGSAACFFCPAGTYAGLTACITCPALKYSTGSGVCMSCPAGRIFNASQTQCDPCSVGSWSDALNSALSPRCLLCIAGRFGLAQNAGSESTGCEACSLGRFSTNLGAVSHTTCELCSPGQFVPTLGATSCTFCPAGAFQDALGTSTCTNCSAGRFSPDSGASAASSCSPCSPGYFSLAGKTACRLCLPGTYAATSGLAECSACPAQDATGAIGCCPDHDDKKWPSKPVFVSMPPGKTWTTVYVIGDCSDDVRQDSEAVPGQVEPLKKGVVPPLRSGTINLATLKRSGVHNCHSFECGLHNLCKPQDQKEERLMPGVGMNIVALIRVATSSDVLYECSKKVTVNFASFGCEPWTILAFSCAHLGVITATILLGIAFERYFRRRTDLFVEVGMRVTEGRGSDSPPMGSTISMPRDSRIDIVPTGKKPLAVLPALGDLHRDVMVALQLNEKELPLCRFRGWHVAMGGQADAVQVEFQVAATRTSVEFVRKKLKSLDWQAREAWGPAHVVQQPPAIVKEVGRLPGADLMDGLEEAFYKLMSLCLPGPAIMDQDSKALHLRASREILSLVMTRRAIRIIAVQFLITFGFAFFLPYVAWLIMTCEIGYPVYLHILWVLIVSSSSAGSIFLILRPGLQPTYKSGGVRQELRSFISRFRVALLFRFLAAFVSATDLYQDATFPVIAGVCGFDLWWVSAWLVFLGVGVMQILVQLLLLFKSWRSSRNARTAEERERHQIEGIFLALRACDNHALVYAVRPAVEERLGGTSCWSMKTVEARVAFCRFIFEDAEQCALQGIFLLFFESASMQDRVWIGLSTATSLLLSFTLAVQTLAEVRDWLWHVLLARLPGGTQQRAWRFRLAWLIVLVLCYRALSVFPWLGACTPAGDKSGSALTRFFLRSGTPVPENVVAEVLAVSAIAIAVALAISAFGIYVWRHTLLVTSAQLQRLDVGTDYDAKARLEVASGARLKGDQDGDTWIPSLRDLLSFPEGRARPPGVEEILLEIDERAYSLSRELHSSQSTGRAQILEQLDKLDVLLTEGVPRQVAQKLRSNLMDGLGVAEARTTMLQLLTDRRFRKMGLAGKARMITKATGGKVPLRMLSWEVLAKRGELPRCGDGGDGAEDASLMIGASQEKQVVLVYLTHTWSRRDHADNSGNSKARGLVQFANWFQSRAETAGMKVKLYFWIDFCCLREDEASAALPVMPLFVAACTEILAWRTADFDRRSWTLMERLLAYCFCRGGLTPYAIDGASFAAREEFEACEEEPSEEEEDISKMASARRTAKTSGKSAVTAGGPTPKLELLRRQRRLLDPREASAGGGGGFGGAAGLKRRVEHLVDMALSVSALETFADRQPVDFGLTAVVELWLGPHEPLEAARGHAGGLKNILAWVSRRAKEESASGTWLAAAVRSDVSSAMQASEWRLVAQTEAGASVVASHLQDDFSVVVVTQGLPGPEAPSPEDIDQLFVEVDAAWEAQACMAKIHGGKSSSAAKHMEQAACDLAMALRADLARAMEKEGENSLRAALQRARDAELPEGPAAVRQLIKLQLERCIKERNIQELKMVIRQAKKEGFGDLLECAAAISMLSECRITQLRNQALELLNETDPDLQSFTAVMSVAVQRDWADIFDKGLELMTKLVNSARESQALSFLAKVYRLSEAEGLGLITSLCLQAWEELAEQGRASKDTKLLIRLGKVAQCEGLAVLKDEAMDSFRSHLGDLAASWAHPTDRSGKDVAKKALEEIKVLSSSEDLQDASDAVSKLISALSKREAEQHQATEVRLRNESHDAGVITSCAKLAGIWGWDVTLAEALSRFDAALDQAAKLPPVQAVQELVKLQNAAEENDLMEKVEHHIGGAFASCLQRQVDSRKPIAVLEFAHAAAEAGSFTLAKLGRDSLNELLQQLLAADERTELSAFEGAAAALGDTEVIELLQEGKKEAAHRAGVRKQQALERIAGARVAGTGEAVAATCIEVMTEARTQGWEDIFETARSIAESQVEEAIKSAASDSEPTAFLSVRDLLKAYQKATEASCFELGQQAKIGFKTLMDDALEARDGHRLASFQAWSSDCPTAEELASSCIVKLLSAWRADGLSEAGPKDALSMEEALPSDSKFKVTVQSLRKLEQEWSSAKEQTELTLLVVEVCKACKRAEELDHVSIKRAAEKLLRRSLADAKESGDKEAILQLEAHLPKTLSVLYGEANEMLAFCSRLDRSLAKQNWKETAELAVTLQSCGATGFAKSAREALRDRVREIKTGRPGRSVESELFQLWTDVNKAGLEDINKLIIEQMPPAWAHLKEDKSTKVKKAQVADAAIIACIQKLVDDTFFGWGGKGAKTATRDRKNPLATRLKVEEVVHVSNAENFLGYCRRRDKVSAEYNKLPAAERAIDFDIKTKGMSFKGVSLHQDEPCDGSFNEYWLWHGTGEAGAAGITDKDFDLGRAGTAAGTMFGRGLYFAESCMKADEYTQSDGRCWCPLVLSRVTLGRIKYCDHKEPHTIKDDLEAACCSGRYHSVCGDREKVRGTFRELIVFDSDQVYPEYIVWYSRVEPFISLK